MRNGRLRAVVPLHDCKGNFLQLVSHAYGLEMVNSGLAVAIRSFSYGNTRVTRYQETVGATASSSSSSMPMIRASEAMANAGLFGRSRTRNLPEFDTKLRDSKQARLEAKNPAKPAEDFIERSQDKIRMWNVVPLLNPRHEAWAG